MEPDIVGGMLRDYEELTNAGIVLFVPWYLLRGEKLDLQTIGAASRTGCEAEHLWDWLGKHPRRKEDEMGDIRYERQLFLYRYHELVIRRRYATASQGFVQSLDKAFAKEMERGEDTVKKLRLELGRVLHGDQPATSG